MQDMHNSQYSHHVEEDPPPVGAPDAFYPRAFFAFPHFRIIPHAYRNNINPGNWFIQFTYGFSYSKFWMLKTFRPFSHAVKCSYSDVFG